MKDYRLWLLPGWDEQKLISMCQFADDWDIQVMAGNDQRYSAKDILDFCDEAEKQTRESLNNIRWYVKEMLVRKNNMEPHLMPEGFFHPDDGVF